MLQLHQIAFRECRTTPRWPTRRSSRCGPALLSTAPTTSPSSTARTSAEDPKTTKTCLSTTGYHRPRSSAWYWPQSNLLAARLHRQSNNSSRIATFRYPAQIVKVDTSGKRFDRQSAARKSLLHVQSGLHAIEDANDSSNTDSVKRRSRSRKPRGNRRNTIAGTDQKEIEGITENGFVSLIQFVCFIDFVEHGVSFAITLGRKRKKVPRTIFPVFTFVPLHASETFADEILIARFLLHTHFFHYNPLPLARDKNSISRENNRNSRINSTNSSITIDGFHFIWLTSTNCKFEVNDIFWTFWISD